jgi:hypothetical protein
MNAMMVKTNDDALPRPWREIRAIYEDVGTQSCAPVPVARRPRRAFCHGPCTLSGAFVNLCASCPRGRDSR